MKKYHDKENFNNLYIKNYKNRGYVLGLMKFLRIICDKFINLFNILKEFTYRKLLSKHELYLFLSAINGTRQ